MMVLFTFHLGTSAAHGVGFLIRARYVSTSGLPPSAVKSWISAALEHGSRIFHGIPFILFFDGFNERPPGFSMTSN